MKNLIYKIIFWLVLFISSYAVLGIELNLLPLMPSHFSEVIVEKINRALLSLAYSSIYILFCNSCSPVMDSNREV